MESFLQKVPLESDDNSSSSSKVVLVTDGQLPLRQCLLPETCTKNISDIPAVFCLFYDLRKEFRKCFPTAADVNSVQDIVNCKFSFPFLPFDFVLTLVNSRCNVRLDCLDALHCMDHFLSSNLTILLFLDLKSYV